ncbi:alpha/beta fold hydrolase [Paenibacillus daejeonensis]|uniref:alpha/beta fold hydrolase n=1 Tax=Paenibacillus daejeonensis TaxID=135193 RepID=UPI00035C8308|nr:alpha/beta hydrolase [Paenibacillus daejeonensis]
MSRNMVNRKANIQGFEMNYYTAGDSGPVVVLVHGAGVDSAMLSWREVIPLLAQHYRVYAPDMPGYGLTGYKEGVEYTNTFYTQVLRDFIHELQLDRPVVIGLSMGGGIVLEFALTYPNHLQALGLINSNGILDRWEYHAFTYHFYVNTPLNTLSYKWMAKNRMFARSIVVSGLFYDPQNVTEGLMDEVQEAARIPNAGRAFAIWQKSEYLGKQGLRSDFRSRMPDITVPTFIVHGTEDRTVPVAHAHKAHELIPGSELFLVEEARHWPHKEKPDEVVGIVHGYLMKTLKNLS